MIILYALFSSGANEVAVAGRRILNTVSTADVASGYASTSSGGTLTVTLGTYTGKMTDYEGVKIEKALTIQCSAADLSCILDGKNDHRVVKVYQVSCGTTHLIGLKITRGYISN